MKLAGFALGMLLSASLVACGAGNNGGWVTKGGWDKSSRAPQQEQPASEVPLTALDLENPYTAPPVPKLSLDKRSPYESDSADSAKAKSDKNEKSDKKNEKQPLKGDEAGF